MKMIQAVSKNQALKIAKGETRNTGQKPKTSKFRGIFSLNKLRGMAEGEAK